MNTKSLTEKSFCKCRIPFLIASIGVCTAGFAADYIWTGGGSDGKWTTKANWVPDTGYPNGVEDTASFTVNSALSVNVDSAVQVAGITVAGVARLTVAGAQITLGANGIVSTSQKDVDISNPISISAEKTPFTNFGSLDPSVNRTIAGSFHLRGVVSGEGGIAKSGRGQIHLYCDNPFKGVFSSRAEEASDGFTYRWDGYFISTSPSDVSSSLTYGSSDVYIYNCGALGRQLADLGGDDNFATQLWVKSPGEIDIPVFVSKTFANCGGAGLTVRTRCIIFTGFSGEVRFKKNVYNGDANDCFEIRSSLASPIDVHFEGYVFSIHGDIRFFMAGSGANFHLHKPIAAGTKNGISEYLRAGYENSLILSDCNNCGMHFYGKYEQNTVYAKEFYLYPGVDVFCRDENVLPAKIDLFSWRNDSNGKIPTFIDLCGNDQLITGFTGMVERAGITSYGFTSPEATPAKMRFVGTGIKKSFGFHGVFKGSAGLEWDPQQSDLVLTLTQAISPTTGEIDVKSGTVILSSGYGFNALSVLKVASGATLEVDASASPEQRVRDLRLSSEGDLKLGKNIRITVDTLVVDDGDPLPTGVYTKDSHLLSGALSGDGEIVVRTFGEPCKWIGSSSGDWNDPDNWSAGKVPDSMNDVLIDGATVFVSASTPKVGELVLERDATLVFSNAVSLVEADSIVVRDGATITCAGPFTNETFQCRVWLKCVDLTVMEGGSIDVSRRGWKPILGTGASGNGTGPGQPGWWFAGATHGGRGAFSGLNYIETIKYPYGDAHEPTTAGSSGQSCKNGNPVDGGGVVRIEASGRVSVNGSILANGGSTKADWENYETGGAGGSIWINAASIEGTGTIAAEGGNGASPDLPLIRYHKRNDNGYDHFPAGGGRIAIYVDGEAQARRPATGLYVSAAEGTYQGRPVLSGYTPQARGFADSDWKCVGAEPGTVYFNDEVLLYQLFGNGLSGRLVGVQALTFPGDVLMNRGHVRSDVEGFTVTVGGDLTIDGDARLDVGGVCMTNRMLTAEVWAGRILNKITVGGDLTLMNGGALEINAAETNATMSWGGEVQIAGSVTVGAGGRLIATCDQTNLGAPRFSVGGNFTVAEGGVVSADGRGGLGGSYFSYSGNFSVNRQTGYGPGAGNGMGSAGYGGAGGLAGAKNENGSEWQESDTYNTNLCGRTYGDAWRPDMCGSGGGCQAYKSGGSGGGLIFIEAGGGILVDGLVTANGFGSFDSNCYDTYSLYRPQAGSGGGIYLCGETFAGSGTITATGGESLNKKNFGSQAPGGGGRIAVRTGYAKQLAGERVKVLKIGESVPGFAGEIVVAAGSHFKGINDSDTEMFFTEVYSAPKNGTVRYSDVILAPGLSISIR